LPFVILLLVTSVLSQPPPYEPTDESLKQHPLPDWYRDAKFGIFIHQGLYSVPGFKIQLKKIFKSEFK